MTSIPLSSTVNNMKRKIVQSRQFSKTIENLLKKRQLLLQDFEGFKLQLSITPEMGDIITGTGGLRKVRLKSASHGKSGGYRVCYYFFVKGDEIFLLFIYAKNVQENLTAQQKKEFKQMIDAIKGEK